MAKWASAAFLDGGLDYLGANATFVMLVKAYTAGGSLATANSNKLAESAMTSGDFTKSSSGNNRRTTTTSKTVNASASSTSGDDLHFIFHDGTNIIWATDETTDQVITSGNPVQIPALTYTANQPT